MLTRLLEAFAREIGEEQLVGAIVLCALERPVDDGIREALSLDAYHPGEPGQWSHTFLIAGPYAGENTPILDCTIRDSKTGGIDWNPDLLDVLRTGISQSGGIYAGLARDYDDPRVHPVAIKYVPSLTKEQRASIVAAAMAIKEEGYHYDVPGLVRELLRLLTEISIPAGRRLLFCSGFCQKVYRSALGKRGDFTDKAVDEDTTPDDLWYSPLGRGYRTNEPLP
jgi:hypothetical protein